MKDWKCDGCHCDTSVDDDFEYEFCCSGLREQCGCMGMPINPVFCDDCEKEITEPTELATPTEPICFEFSFES